MNGIELISLCIIGGLLIGQLIRALIIEIRLRNPRDHRVIYLDQVEHVSSLNGAGPFLIRVSRQSGNLQQGDRIADDPNQAVKAAVTTMKRAGISYVCVPRNSESILRMKRPYHSHRGRAEGKKVGSIEVLDLSTIHPSSKWGNNWMVNTVLIKTALGLLGFLSFVWGKKAGLW